jgi:hypothetical protein
MYGTAVECHDIRTVAPHFGKLDPQKIRLCLLTYM